MLTSQKFPTPLPDTTPQCGSAMLQGFLLTLPQWGLCDLIPIPPTLFKYSCWREGVQLAVTQKSRSVFSLRHQQWKTAMGNPRQERKQVSAWSLLFRPRVSVLLINCYPQMVVLCAVHSCLVHHLQSWTTMMSMGTITWDSSIWIFQKQIHFYEEQLLPLASFS